MEHPKIQFKDLINGVTRAVVSPLIFAMRAEQATLGPGKAENVFQAYSQLVSLVPGLQGEYVRRAFYEKTIECKGADLTVGFGTVFSKQEVSVGNRVYIGMNCTLGNVILEDHVTIGSNVDILSGTSQHSFEDLDTPIQDQGGVYQTVRIGGNTWIGNGAIVMAEIGRNCVIGAGSLVNRPIPDNVIAVGNPARVVRER